MSANISVSDETKGELLPYSGEVNFSYGVSAPYPTDTQAPVPSATFRTGGDVDNLYRLDNVARIEAQHPYVQGREKVFGGRFSTSSDLPVSSMSIDHGTNQLNKDIRTWPIMTNKATDTSNGRRTIMGALRHIYNECNLTEFGVTGDFLFSVTNAVPTIGYYDDPIKRFIPYYWDKGKDSYIAWEPTGPRVADLGAPFDVGNTVTYILKVNENYGIGGATPQRKDWNAFFNFTSAYVDMGADESILTESILTVWYNYANQTLTIAEARQDGNWINVKDINVAGTQVTGPPKFVTIEATRVGERQIHYDFRVHKETGIVMYDYVSNNTVFPKSLSLVQVRASQIADNPSSPSVAYEGVQAVYVMKGKDWGINEEDEYPISLQYFDKPYLKDIVVPGLSGNAWSLIHDLCNVYSLQFDPIHGLFRAYEDSFIQPWATGEGSQVAVQASTRELAETVEVVNYNYTASPEGFWGRYTNLYRADSVYSIQLGQREEHVIQLEEGTTFLNLSQPVCVTVPTMIKYLNSPDSPYSAYSVYDDDNLEVDPRSWNDGGGFVSVEATENLGEIKITIQAPNNELISKETNFHLSVAGSDIPGLMIAGNGIKARKETITSSTGAGKARNLKRVGTTYDNPMVSNTKTAWNVAAGLAALHGTTQSKATGTFPSADFPDFSALPVLRRGSYYTPTSIDHQGSTIRVSDSVRFTPVNLVKDKWGNITCKEYQDKWAKNTLCREVNISPLGRESW